MEHVILDQSSGAFGEKYFPSGEVRKGRSKAIRSSLPDPGSFNAQ